MDESSGGITSVSRADSHGSNDLSDPDTIPSATGLLGNAISVLHNNQEFLTASSNASLVAGKSSWSWATWCRPLFDEGDPTNPYVIFKGDLSTAGGVFEYGLNFNDPGLWQMSVRDQDGNNYIPNVDVGTLVNGQWYFVASTMDRDNGELRIYVDNLSPGIVSVPDAADFTSSGPLAVGAREGDFTGTTWEGLIDQTSFWKRSLSSAEVSKLYNGGTPLPLSEY